MLRLWHGFTILHNEEGIPYVSFGDVMLEDVQAMARSKNYRVITVDAPVGLATG